jgi:hypothetical protein
MLQSRIENDLYVFFFVGLEKYYSVCVCVSVCVSRKKREAHNVFFTMHLT